MNRILFDETEISKDKTVVLNDARAEHILKILHGSVGQELKTGVVNGLIGKSKILSVENNVVTLKVEHSEESIAPWIDLILAPPRPRILKRLLPQLSAMGVGKIILTGAKKVEKDFWGATLLKEEIFKPLLIDGLMQAGTTSLPELLVRRSFRNLMDEEIDMLCPSRARILAHPYGSKLSRAQLPRASRLLLAIGPEGGWTDDEVARLEQKGFLRYSLGSRILRSDTATIALLAQLME